MLLAPYCNCVRTTTKCGVIVIYLRNGNQALDDYKIGNLGEYPKYPKEIKKFSLFGFEEWKWKERAIEFCWLCKPIEEVWHRVNEQKRSF